MVKFIAMDGVGPLIGLGLSEQNLRKLREGMPIYTNGKEMGLSHNIYIFYGKTEDDMFEMMKDKIGDKTEIFGTKEK